ncbi:Hypothetical Protein FCC1311_097472 [Hondaea fermentalgiana]|uniref:PH domain-containing protein n=1 Tax=Hondaea fermentalgiana TaxID=2315210 RepID=A0A2R5GZQ0_9STRA|nr:Hypothetical Protein FCC1311_097472 [Hondaea fermentalgiana]|eukprot:GBG33524.1 Hypothetical Protein FCC1311_097472 [Hondaea fermentalgiana]
MEGFLGVPKSGRWKDGHERYFVVDLKRKAVCSGKDTAAAHDASAKKLPASNFTAAQMTGVTAGEFRILTKRNTYLFRAKSTREARKWVAAVEDLMEYVGGAAARHVAKSKHRIKTSAGGTKSSTAERLGLVAVGSVFTLVAVFLVALTSAIAPKQQQTPVYRHLDAPPVEPAAWTASFPESDLITMHDVQDTQTVYEQAQGAADMDDASLPPAVYEANQGKGTSVLALALVALIVVAASVVYGDRKRLGRLLDSERRRIRKAIAQSLRETSRSVRKPFEDLADWMNNIVSKVTGLFSFGESKDNNDDEEVAPEDLGESAGSSPAERMRAAGPKYAKYARMLSNGVPEGAVRQALVRDNISAPRGIFEDESVVYSRSNAKQLRKELPKAKKSSTAEPPAKRRSLRREPSVIDELRERQRTLGIFASDDDE